MTQLPRRGTITVLAILLAIAAAGCRTEDTGSSEGRNPYGADVVIEVALLDDRIDMLDTVAGEVIAFDVANQDGLVRSFVVEGEGERDALGSIRPADSERLIVSLEPGSYTISSQGGGQDLETTLTVNPPPPASATPAP